MAIIKCPECGKEISDKATSCPNCGFPLIKGQPEKEKPKEPSTVEKVLKSSTARQVGSTVARELTRGLLGVLGLGRSSRKKKSWF